MSKANYDLPDETIKEVMKVSGAKTKKEALILALEAYLVQKQLEMLIKSYGKMPLKWDQKTLKKYRG